MPFSKKRKVSKIAFKKKHVKKKRKESSNKETTPSIKQKPLPVVHNDAKDGTGLPFVSPVQTTREETNLNLLLLLVPPQRQQPVLMNC